MLDSVESTGLADGVALVTEAAVLHVDSRRVNITRSWHHAGAADAE